MFDKIINKIEQGFQKLYTYLKSKLHPYIYSFIYPYLDLIKRMGKGAVKGMKMEYNLWKDERSG